MEQLKDIQTIAFVGMGLIGSSLARAIQQHDIAETLSAYDISQDVCDEALSLRIVDAASTDPKILNDADVVFMCVPVGTIENTTKDIMLHLKTGSVLTDVSSTKGSVIKDVMKHLREDIHFVAGHPLAGTEKSGPSAGFAELFEKRWCILTPDDTTKLQAVEIVRQIWEAVGAKVEMMDVEQHDQILAMTSHLPHLIAYTIVGTASDLGDDMKTKVIEYAASGFRDFTRIAASNPTIWSDIFVNNQEAVLDVLQRFTEDLTLLQKYIRRGNVDELFEYFTKTRSIHAEVIKVGQDHSTDEGA